MSQARFLGRLCLACAIVLLPATGVAQAATLGLVGLDYGTSDLYSVSTTNASLTLLGNLGVQLATLEYAPNGTLYGFTVGSTPWLYSVDPQTATATQLTRIGDAIFLFEGAMAFSSTGVAYAVNMSQETNNKLFTFDIATGQVTSIVTLDNGPHDFNGLAWRSDNKLVGIDQSQNALIVIDPATGATSVLQSLSSLNQGGKSILGSIGGLTAIGDEGYFATAGPTSVIKGSNELYRFNMFTGAAAKVGTFSPALPGKGIGAIAAVPEPVTIAFLAMGCLMAWPRRR